MWIFSVLVQLACYVHFSREMKTYCMAPPVRLGDEATLFCLFEADISKVQHDVLVYVNKGDTEYPVMIYAWHDGQSRIHTMEGYHFEGKISDYLVIKILNVSKSIAGQYSCLVALSKDRPTPCTLNITDPNLDSSVVAVGKDPTLQYADSSVKMSTFMSTEKYVFQAHNIFDEHHKSKFYIAAIVLGVMFGVVVVTFLTILFIAIYKRWIPRRCCTQSVLNSDVDSINSSIKSKKDICKPPSIGKTNIERDKDQQQSLLV